MTFSVTSPGLPFVKDIKAQGDNVEVDFEFHGNGILNKDIRLSLEKILTKKGEVPLEGEIEIITEKNIRGKNRVHVIFRFSRRKMKNYYFNFVAKVRNSVEEYHFCQKIEFANPQ